MVKRPGEVVLNQDMVAIHRRRGRPAVLAVGGGERLLERAGGLVHEDDGVLPVVAVATGEGGVGVVLGHVPGVHDGDAAVVLGGAGVRLALALVSAGAAGTARCRKSTTTFLALEQSCKRNVR